jgi:ABC-type transport system substrate-binding protein
VVLGTGVAGYLEQIGIRAEIEQMDGTRYTELFTRGGMNPWYVNTWTHSTLDNDVALNWFLSDLTTSPVRYRNPNFDKALKDSKVEMDAAKRVTMLRDAQRILLTEEPVTTPLVYNPYYWVAAPKIANFKLLPSSKIDVTGLYVKP